jgi:LPXTG-motif cell wall-anchored protein
VALGVIFGLFVVPTAPASAQYIPGQPGCIADPTQIDANTATSGTITCIGCPPGTTAGAYVVVDGEEVQIGSAQVGDDEDGGVTISVSYPSLPPGDYTTLVRCGDVVLSNVLTVVGLGGQQVGRGPLPVTGSDSRLLLQIAITLVVIGGLLAIAARKRRHAYA